MKQLLAITLLFAACSQDKPKNPPKEERTIVMYPFRGDQNDFRTGAAFKITIDSVGLDSLGKVNRKDFTYYRVAVSYKLHDSTGRPRIDSLGRHVDTMQWIDMAEKAVIHDFKKDWIDFVPKEK